MCVSMAQGEKPGERAPLGKRRKFMAVTDTAAEHTKVIGHGLLKVP